MVTVKNRFRNSAKWVFDRSLPVNGDWMDKTMFTSCVGLASSSTMLVLAVILSLSFLAGIFILYICFFSFSILYVASEANYAEKLLS